MQFNLRTSHLKLLCLLGAVGLLLPASSHSSGAETVEVLFDGRTLDGWQNFGGGKFYVEDGVIVGESLPGYPNSFLATAKQYDNFELEVDFMIDPLINSGIQIRSGVHAETTAATRWGGRLKPDGSKDLRKVSWEKGRFWGYQVEIDPSEKCWTGSLYEEAGRGFLHAPVSTATVYRSGEWNHFRIVADGSRIQTWLNGVPVIDLQDNLTPTGYIALQLHGVAHFKEKIGQKVRWKNISLRKLRGSAGDNVDRTDGAKAELLELGGARYASACALCHQPGGQGVPSVYPPLAGSDWVAGPADRLAAIVSHGLTGPIVVNGVKYPGVPMPAFGAEGTYQWNSRDIAAVLTYVRQSWGNKAGEVEPELVERVRQKLGSRGPLTSTDLDQIFPLRSEAN